MIKVPGVDEGLQLAKTQTFSHEQVAPAFQSIDRFENAVICTLGSVVSTCRILKPDDKFLMPR